MLRLKNLCCSASWLRRPILLTGLLLITSTWSSANGLQSLKQIRERGVVMQHFEISCAAATLATVLTYGFHDAVAERPIAEGMLRYTSAAKVKSQGGFSMLDMKHVLADRGYHAAAYGKLSLIQLKLFHAPIVPIDSFGNHHYVVFNGVHGQNVRLADPAFGNREMPIDTFTKLWIDGLAFVVSK